MVTSLPEFGAPSVTSVNFSLEAFTLLLQRLGSPPTQPNGAIPVTPPTLSLNPPPFHSSASSVIPIGESLYDLFPLVETGTILEITKHTFKPLDLFKLDPTLHDKNMDLKTTLDLENGSITAKAKSGSLRDYPQFTSLLEPLMVYFNILSAYAASSGNVDATYAIAQGTCLYVQHLSTLNCSYTWHAVLQYHKAFFLLRCREMARGDYSGWTRSDGQLMNTHLYHQICSSSSGSVRTSTRPAPASKQLPISQQTCYSFNKGSCPSSPCPSGWIHKCQKCDDPNHGAHACTKST
ncbi:hypothetical protein BYT27DRAFT_7082109 [Phlegmacium glaucopus]|nr:hypothetical protein BYT27DRAFT_7082109 [Phlegmacium glaucopus]